MHGGREKRETKIILRRIETVVCSLPSRLHRTVFDLMHFNGPDKEEKLRFVFFSYVIYVDIT